MKSPVRRLSFLCLVLLGLAVILAQSLHAQDNPNFNVTLNVDFASAERVLDLCDGRFVNTGEMAAMRGNQIAAATAEYIAASGKSGSLLKSYLDSLNDQAPIQNDLYHLRETRDKAPAIRAFMNEIRKSNFNRRVAATVEQIFPRNARVSAVIPVYFVVFGHQNVDAYVRRIVWNHDIPEFVGDNQGELTIVVNLAKAVEYEGEGQEKLIRLLGVVAHEVFHAAFGAYKDESPTWRRISAKKQRPFDALTDITQNEGIAYYLSIDQEGGGRIPSSWQGKMSDVVQRFNKNADELLSASLSPRRAGELLRSANLAGGDWQSYGAMTGMTMARAIDLVMGRGALIETIALGPEDFFRKYLAACERQGNLPPLSKRVIADVSRQ